MTKNRSTAQSWKKSAAKSQDLEVPSGNVCLVKRPDTLKMLLQGGTIPNALMPIIKEHLATGEGTEQAPKDEIIARTLADAGALEGMVEMIDKVVVACVVEPKVLRVPEDEDDRDEDNLYVDEIDFADKVYIFSWAMGGADDLASFREEPREGVGAVPQG